MTTKRLIIASVILLIFGGYLKAFPFSHQAVPLQKPLDQIPLVIDDWGGRDLPLEGWVLDMLNLSNYLQREYRRGGERVIAYVGYYATQTGGAEIHSPTLCLPGSGWVALDERVKSLTLDNGRQLKFLEATYAKDDAKEVFIYWYQVGQGFATSKYTLKLQTMISALERRRTDAAFIRFSAPVLENEEKTAELIEEFMNDFLPLLERSLPG